jgi:hypothetical protein
VQKLVAGDTLLLKDGTYYSGITVGVSGSIGNPVTIKAVNDGGAIVDGQGSRVPLDIAGRSYVDVEGIIFKNSASDVVRVRSGSSHVNLRRLSGMNAGKGNYLVFLVSNSSYVLIEDCFGTNYGGSSNAYGGNGRHLFELYNGATNCTLRRNYGRYYQHNGGGGDAGDGIVLYGSGSGNVMENNVMDFSVAHLGTGIYSFKPLSTNTTGGASTKASWYGNVVIGGPYVSVMAGFGATATAPQSQSGYIWKGNVLIGNGSQDGMDQYSSYDSTIQNNTIVSPNAASGLGVISVYTTVSGYPSTATVKNNSLVNDTVGLRCYGTGASTASRYNNFHDISTVYSGAITDKTGDKILDLTYDTVTYGKGAYLMVPPSLQGGGEGGADVGGEVLYQSVEVIISARR